jgi:division protein CdvB (Snf7/Vps24/ESCRT-III family)
LFKRKKDPLRKGFELLRDVRILKDRVSKIQSRIDERAEELSKKLVDLQMKGEKYLAARYAEEIARLKDLSQRFSLIMFILDKVDLAIQHSIMRNEFQVLAEELKDLVKEVVKLPEARIPDVSVLFADLEASVRELSEVSMSEYSLSYNPPSNSEVKAILEEAKEVLRKKLEPAS